MSNEYLIKFPVLHKHQAEFVNSNAPRRICRAGRRSGKTVGSAILAVEKFLNGRRVLYGAPTSDQLDRFWITVCRVLGELIDVGLFKKNETLHTIEKTGTNQRIRGKTCWSADTLRGDYADLLILDEYQLMNEDAWEFVGAPMLLDNDGDAIFIYTPPSFRTRSVSKAYDPQHAAKLFKKAQLDTTGRWETFAFTSHDNPHISKDALENITQDMTALAYKQEIMAEDIEEVPGALWMLAMIDKNRVTEAPPLKRIVIPIDPQGKTIVSAETGIIPCGLGMNGHGYVLEDISLNARPEVWGSKAIEAYEKWKADRIIAEVNYGGEMVEAVILSINPHVSVKTVHASRGKLIRAEPISAKYEKGLIHHVGKFPRLEDEMCTYTTDSKWSPNRLDSMVWGMTELMLHPVSQWSKTVTSTERESMPVPF